jgi:outer membrane lipoprotein-sorting protein
MPTRRQPRFPLQRCAALAALALTLPALTGCVSLFVSKRKLLVPIAPATVQTASADQLVASMNQSWDKFQSMTAAVDIQASHLKAKEGIATDYPTFRANLLLSKPNKLRILGRTPLVQTTMFDLASDGTNFTLVIPHNNVVYHGLNSSKGSSPNWYENLRPGFLFNAMIVRGLDPEEFYSVTSESITEEDLAKKHLMLHPEYVLSIVRRKPGSQEQFPVRVVRFHREDLLPYEQDLYDDQGIMETQVLYGPYKDFDGVKYPGTITLKRPQDEYQLVMTVERIVSNPTLTDDQFQAVIPKGSTVKEMQ